MSIDQKSLRIKDLSIGKMPGFKSGMAPFKDFSPSINIITGPNAAGKSTTARAIQKLIWQHDTDQIQIDGHADIGSEPWMVRIESSRHIVQRRGVDDEMNGIPAAEGQNRYMLALHELIQDDGEDLAHRIIRESVGGYDPDSAGEELDYNNRISTTGTGQYKNFSESEKDVRESKESQKKIKEEEQKLSDLYRQRAEAEEADKKAAFYNLVLDKMKAEQSFEELRDLKVRFPSVLANAHGEELQRVREIEEEISNAKGEIQKAETIASECRKKLSELTIPEEGVPEKVLDELEIRVKRIEELENEIADLEKDQKSLEKKRSEALKRIGEDTIEYKLRALNLQDVGDLDQFLQDAHRTASEKRVLEQEIKEFEKESSREVDDPEAVRNAIGTLSNWLKEVPADQPFPAWVILVIALLAVGSAIAGYFVPEAGLAGLVAILLLAMYGWMQIRTQGKNEIEKIRIEDFKQTGLTMPNAWNSEEVRNRLDELIAELRNARWKERFDGKLENSRASLKKLDSRIKATSEQGKKLQEKLSILPDLPFEEPAGYSQLAWFIKVVQNWQAADTELLALGEKLKETEKQFSETLAKTSELINPYTESLVNDYANADAEFKGLRKQEDVRQKDKDEILRQQSAIETQQEIINRKKKDLNKIYDKFEIPAGEKDQLRDLVEQLDEYKKVMIDFRDAEREYQKRKRSLEEHSLYGEEQDRLAEVTLDQAEAHRETLLEESEKLKTIRDEIAGIEARVETVKSGNSLERALKSRDEAVEDLKELYEDNLSSLTGQLLVDTLKEEMREQNRPKVFKGANRIFNRITKGRYELEIDEKGDPEFRAYDAIEKIGRSLDELSSGTRIQLLMAVRLAFVETQESSLKLPILADELLANSDDVRAEAIIEALTEISRDGRQVFYFTAQGDEVAKWKSYLNRNGIDDHKVFYLTGDKSVDRHKSTQPDWQPISLVQDIPEPGSLSYKAYSEKLNVPLFNPLINEPEQLHLWYLLDETQMLYKTLISGVKFWGALKNYVKEGGVIEGLGDQEVKKMEEKAELLERYLTLYRRGRPRPIDRSVLEKSGAVSDSFIEAVSDKLNELKGNPLKLINALRNSEVSGFRTNKMDELENYLLEQGYLDSREPMDSKNLTVAMYAFISNLELSREEAEQFLGRLNSRDA